MAIEFHCEHCNHLIKASLEVAGQTGKCPRCGVETYLPRPVEEDEELPLEPLDEEFERHRRQSAQEDAAYQRKLLQEQAIPGEKRRPRTGSSTESTPGGAEQASSRRLVKQVVAYLEAMGNGQLEQAEELAKELAKNKTATAAILDGMEADDLAGYGLPTLPRPVFLGFLNQLRTRL